MNALVPASFGQLSTRFAGTSDESLGAGIQSAMPVLSIKGKAFRLKYRGIETVMMRKDGDGAMSSLPVVIVKASQTISKIFYERGYVEGSTEPPDCWSTNGATPDASATKKQSASCASCPMNAWGARITPAGKPGKRCADSKRIAVVPLDDIDNEAFGGPVLLRVPAASLGELKSYGDKMHSIGYPYYAIGTRIAFDPGAEYPKLVFSGIRALEDDEAAKVLALRDSDAVRRVLNETLDFDMPAPAEEKLSTAALFEQPPEPKPEPKVGAKPEPKTKKPAPKEVVDEHGPLFTPKQQELPLVPDDEVPATGGAAPAAFEAELDAELDKLLG